MGTPYDKIYRRFLTKITDYDFLQFDASTKYRYMCDLLTSACDDFEICQHDLQARDDVTMEFDEDLTSKEMEILSEGMLLHWVEPKVLDAGKFLNFLNTKDYYLSGSPATLFAQAKDLKEQTYIKLRGLINEYSYRNGKIDELGKG